MYKTTSQYTVYTIQSPAPKTFSPNNIVLKPWHVAQTHLPKKRDPFSTETDAEVPPKPSA